MESSDKRPNRPKARQSIAHMPSSRLNGVDKQNATIDLSAARNMQDTNPQLPKKRTRGKSLGPCGLEALSESDGNIIKTVPTLQLRSILKPTVPLTPPKSIPTFDELRQRSTRKRSPTKNGNTEALLIDFSTPGPSHRSPSTKNVTSSNAVADPFSPFKMNHIRDDAQAQNNDEVNEEEMRREQKKFILEQRAARRKSMANRRVSFAPEATLHTWSVMEMMEDSTTSSTSNSTRGQSSVAAPTTTQYNDPLFVAESESSNPLSISPEQIEEPAVKASPANQRSLYQNKRRRSSASPADVDVYSDEIYSSSPSGDVAATSSPIRIEDSVESDSDTDGDTAMSIDEMTQNTIHSQISGSSTHSSLEERLRQAATQAGTRGIEYDEYGDDVSMEIANDTVTNAFQPWTRIQQQPASTTEDLENVNPFPQAPKFQEVEVMLQEEEDQNDTTQGLAMEMTRVMGGILDAANHSPKSRRKSAASRRRSGVGRRQSIAANSSYEDETMDFTTMAGGILSRGNEEDGGQIDSDGEMTMEFTTAVGGLHDKDRRESTQVSMSDANESMDMTAAVGGILEPIEEQTEPRTEFEYEETQDDQTVAMEMTRAVGHILTDGVGILQARQIMQGELDEPTQSVLDETRSSLRVSDGIIQSTPKHLSSIASETGSPSLALKPRSSGRTRSARMSQTSTPKSSRPSTPQKVASIKKQSTPTKQLTPVPTRAKTPERTPLSANVTHRGASPKRLFQSEIKARSSPAAHLSSTPKPKDPLFAQDDLSGRQIPRVVLHAPQPHQHLRRRSSGIGIDQQGFGSPSVTQLLDRRASIGEAALPYKLETSQPPRLRFEDPKQIADDIDAERADDERRESGRYMMEQESNEQQEENATLQLKEMIESLTPKKNRNNKFKGRKSLAVGSARGLLGKRPAELDDDNNEDGDSTPKRLKVVSREASPIKKVHLPKPPSKEETTGRLTKIEQRALETDTEGGHTPALRQSPPKADTIRSPQHGNRYRDISHDPSMQRPTSFENKLDNVIGAIDSSIEHSPRGKVIPDEEKISLQQFLNMTNVHFIELNTTKRRHTIAQSIANEILKTGMEHSNSIESCFIAAATTMPLLELYQHATRELKSYISTGRKIIRTIEGETLAEQPALFKEYIDARPDIKLVMDNQFRNGKVNARLQSKEGWYTWRSQLVDGLQTGLQTLKGDLKKDLLVVQEQAKRLDDIVPQLAGRLDGLTTESKTLNRRLEEIESVDHNALRESRQELRFVNQKLEERLATLEELQQQMREKDEALSQAAELKDEMREQIAEAERVREEHRGWATKDITSLELRVNDINKQSGWSLLSTEDVVDEPDAHGTALALSYKKTLRLYFHPTAYQSGSENARRRSARSSRSPNSATTPISLTYSPILEDTVLHSPLPTEKRFFLQLMQSQLHAVSTMPRGLVSSKSILNTVSSGWELACKVSEELRLLGMTGIVRASIKSDETLSVKLMLVLRDRSRVDVEFTLSVTILDDGGVSAATSINASAVYGPVTKILDVSKTRRVQNALGKEIENRALGLGAWVSAVQAFEVWHHAQPQPSKPVDKPKATEAVNIEETAPVGSTTPKSPAPIQTKTPATRRSPMTVKKSSVIQKKIPVPTIRQDRFKTSQREQLPSIEKAPAVAHDLGKEKENLDPFYSTGHQMPAITPAMQEAMMLRTPIKRVGALRRSPV